MRYITLGLAAFFAFGGLSGCIFSPDKGKGGGGGGGVGVVFVRPEQPEHVLDNLISAYETRDSVEYRKLFALNYQGGSYDTSEAGGIDPGTFTWADEVRHIQKLRQNNDILGVNLDLGSKGTWVRTSATGPSGEAWAEIVIFNPTLQIDTSIDSYVLKSNEVLTFTFAPETPAPASSTDTLWSIVRWFEDGAPGP